MGREHDEADLPVFEDPARWLDMYFSGKAPGFTPMLRMEKAGTAPLIEFAHPRESRTPGESGVISRAESPK